MKIANIVDFYRGWFIGNFEPSILKTEDFEVGLLIHKKDEYWAPHYHNVATEYNLLIEGEMEINGRAFVPGDIFIIEKGEVAEPKFYTDCKVLVIKVPSVNGDKYVV